MTDPNHNIRDDLPTDEYEVLPEVQHVKSAPEKPPLQQRQPLARSGPPGRPLRSSSPKSHAVAAQEQPHNPLSGLMRGLAVLGIAAMLAGQAIAAWAIWMSPDNIERDHKQRIEQSARPNTSMTWEQADKLRIQELNDADESRALGLKLYGGGFLAAIGFSMLANFTLPPTRERRTKPGTKVASVACLLALAPPVVAVTVAYLQANRSDTSKAKTVPKGNSKDSTAGTPEPSKNSSAGASDAGEDPTTNVPAGDANADYLDVIARLQKMIDAQDRRIEQHSQFVADDDAEWHDPLLRAQTAWGCYKAAALEVAAGRLDSHAFARGDPKEKWALPSIPDGRLFMAALATGGDYNIDRLVRHVTGGLYWKLMCDDIGKMFGVEIAKAYASKSGRLWRILEGLED